MRRAVDVVVHACLWLRACRVFVIVDVVLTACDTSERKGGKEGVDMGKEWDERKVWELGRSGACLALCVECGKILESPFTLFGAQILKRNKCRFGVMGSERVTSDSIT